MLTVITGPMFSGKSSALISKAMAHVIAGDFVVAFKPSNDDRYDKSHIVTHGKNKFPAYPIDIKNVRDSVYECLDKIAHRNAADVICFDEAQFFESETFISAVEDFTSSSHVIVAGLIQDYKGVPFGAMPHVAAIADNIVCLKAVCSKCKKINAATRTFRKIKDTKQVVVGGTDVYEARCFECWMDW